MNSSSKTIFAILIIAIAVLAYLMATTLDHDPVTLPPEAKDSLLQDDEGAQLWEENRDAILSNDPPKDLEGLEETPLDLSLLGTVSSDVETEASATIQSRLQVRTYFIDDQIAYTNAVLVEIRNDRVILLIDGEQQVLLLQGTRTSDTTNADPNSQNTANPDFSNANDPEVLAKRIGNRPKLLEHIIAVQPHTASNGDLGYLLEPGKNPKLYKAIKFKDGDLLQKVNGHDVNTEEGLESIQALIPNAQTLVFSVLREGRVISLYLDIPSEGLNIKSN